MVGTPRPAAQVDRGGPFRWGRRDWIDAIMSSTILRVPERLPWDVNCGDGRIEE
jgi:hypothetical protein